MSKATIETFYRELGREFESYKGIRALSAPGVHAAVVETVRPYLGAGSSVLDVGCGRGALSLRLFDEGYQVEACDIFDHCEVKDKVRFVHAAAEEADFRGPYDAVFMVEFLIATENPYGLIRRYTPFIRPGGYLVISTAHVDSDRSRAEFFLRGRHDWFQPHNVEEDGALSPLFQFQVEFILGELGLELIERRPILPHDDPPLGVTWSVLQVLRTYQRVKGIEPEDGRIVIYVARRRD